MGEGRAGSVGTSLWHTHPSSPQMEIAGLLQSTAPPTVMNQAPRHLSAEAVKPTGPPKPRPASAASYQGRVQNHHPGPVPGLWSCPSNAIQETEAVKCELHGSKNM